MMLDESPNIQWFDKYCACRVCGKASAGILRGNRNDSYGDHCEKCAKKRIEAAKKVRAQLRAIENKA